MAEPPLLIASAFTRDPRKRLQLATDLIRSFPFGSPSYQWGDVISPDKALAFDCVKCPVAEFFARNDSSELCVQTFCRLGYPLAESGAGGSCGAAPSRQVRPAATFADIQLRQTAPTRESAVRSASRSLLESHE